MKEDVATRHIERQIEEVSTLQKCNSMNSSYNM